MNYTLQLVLIALGIGGITYLVSTRKEQYRAQQDESTIMVGTNAEYQPFTFREGGQIVGFDIDIVKEVVNRLNKGIVIQDMSFGMLLPKLQSGSLQIVAAGVSPSPEREGQVFFTKPYLSNDPLIIITRADQPALASLADLTGKEVVVNDGFTADLELSRLQGPIIKRLPTVTEAFLALISKRADAFVSARSAAEPFFQQADRSKFNVNVLPGVLDSYVLMISRKYPELFKQVQEALDAMEQDNTIATIKQKWNLS
jgi:polar amino acid transport system substrate-binding protein